MKYDIYDCLIGVLINFWLTKHTPLDVSGRTNEIRAIPGYSSGFSATQLARVCLASYRGHADASESRYLGGGFDSGAILQQQFDHLDSILLARNM